MTIRFALSGYIAGCIAACGLSLAVNAQSVMLEAVPLAEANRAQLDAALRFLRVGGRADAEGKEVFGLIADTTGGARVVAIDGDGRIRLLGEWRSYVPCETGLFVEDGHGRWHAWQHDGRPLALPAGTQVGQCYMERGRAWIGNKEHWFALDGTKLSEAPTANDSVAQRHANPQELAPEAGRNGLFGYRRAGRWIVEPQFDGGWPMRAGVAKVHLGGATLAVDDQGRFLTPIPTRNIFEPNILIPAFRDEAWRAHRQGWHTIDRFGAPVNWFGLRGEEVRQGTDRWYVRMHGAWLMVMRDGLIREGPTQGRVESVHSAEGLAPAKDEKGCCYGYLDLHDRWAIAPRFSEAGDFVRGAARVVIQREGQQHAAWIDGSGQMVTSPDSRAGIDSDLVEGKRRVGVNGRWGYADASNRVVVPPRFEAAEPFSEGLAAVRSGGQWGYLDSAGKMAISPAYREAGPFVRGIARVVREEVVSWIDRTGREIVFDGPIPEVMRAPSDGLAAARTADFHWGFVDERHRWAIEPRYAAVTDFVDGEAAVTEESYVSGFRFAADIEDVTPNGLIVLVVCREHDCRRGLLDHRGRLLPARAQ